MKLYIKCPDGFMNQLRLSLAANYLVKHNYIEHAEQEWVINNHNIVEFSEYYHPLKRVIFTDNIQNDDLVTTQSFAGLLYPVKRSVEIAFRESYKDLKLKDRINTLVNEYLENYPITECIGLHVRTGCKTALLKSSADRSEPFDMNQLICELVELSQPLYLATDNQQTQLKFKNIFGDRLLYYQDINKGKEDFGGLYDRNKVERHTSQDHVVADLLILQKCKKFIGSNESSLSLAVKCLRNKYVDNHLVGSL